MFTVTAEEAAAIRLAWETSGELGASIEVRRLFPGISDMENARRCARAIAGWPARAEGDGTTPAGPQDGAQPARRPRQEKPTSS